jgi:nitrogen fixation NifU-like protein
MNMYQETLLDYYRNPRNKGHIADADFKSEQYNPSCGDKVSFEGKIQQDAIDAIAFQGHGCVISLATASMLAEHASGKSVQDIHALTPEFILSLVGISLGPTRLKCALLPLQALQEGIAQYQAKATVCSTEQN